MKKQLLTMLLCLTIGFANGQYSYLTSYNVDAGNPGGVNTDNDASGTAGWKLLLPGSLTANQWSVVDTIPFAFDFFGTPVSTFKASANGLVTFDVASGALPSVNDNLPSPNLPDMTICGLWDEFTASAPTGSNDDVRSKVYGVPGAQQYWIRWYSFEYGNPANGFAYFSIVLEEGTNNIYVVDMYGTATNPHSATVGVQLNSSVAVQFGDNTISNSANGSLNPDNDYWSFSPFLLVNGNIQPTAMTAPNSPVTVGTQPVNIDVNNTGQDTVTSFTVTWTVNGIGQTPYNYVGSLAPFATTNINLGTYNVIPGFTNFEFITNLPNGAPDGDPSNDTLATSVCTGLAGVFTVDPSGGGNYLNLSEVATDLVNCGLSGAVTYNLAPGLHVGGIELPVIAGNSASNSITFDGANAATVENAPGVNAIFQFTGADYVTVKNMTVQHNANVTDSWGFHSSNSSDFNTFDNLIVNMPVSTVFDNSAFVASSSITSGSGEGINANFNVISNCTITGGDYGIHYEGDDIDSTYYTSGNSFIGNYFSQQDDYCIYLDNQQRLAIIDNVMEQTNSTFGDGMYLSDVNDYTITGNFVNSQDYGLYIFDGNVDFVPQSRGKIINNMFMSIDSRGLYLNDVANTDVQFNSCYGAPAAYFNDLFRVDVRNNLFYGENDYAIESLDPLGAEAIDYNLYYNTGTDLIRDGLNYYIDLTSWKTGAPTINANSVSGDPVIVSPTDLHLLGVAANDVGDNTVPIQVDIDGDVRPLSPSTTVDIGADEYTPPAIDGFALKVYLDNFDCGSDSTKMYAIIGSQGQQAIDTVQINAVVDNGSGPINFNPLYVGNLVFPNVDTVYVGMFNSTAGGTYVADLYLDIIADSDTTNNFATDTFNLGSLAPVTGAMGGAGCVGGNGPAWGPDAINYRWFTDSVGGSLVGSGDTISYGPISPGGDTVWVAQPGIQRGLPTTMVGGNGCGGGNMVDISITSDLVLEGVTASVNTTGPTQVSLYYILNSGYTGNETNPAAWTLWESMTVNALGSGNETPIIASTGIALSAGQTIALYVEFPATYTTGANVYSNADMTVSTGIGLCSSFGGTNNPRTLNGSIVYSKEACTEARSPVVISALPSTNPDYSFVVNNFDVTFTDLSVSPDSVSWDFGDGNTSSLNNPVHTYGTFGTYVVCLTAYSATCGALTYCDTVEVTCVPPNADYTYQSANGQVSFTDASTNADSVWYTFGDGNSSSLQNPIHTYAANGVYSACQFAMSAACGLDSVCYQITITGVGIDENFLGFNNLFPNPTSGLLTVEFKEKTTDESVIKVLDLSGRLIKSIQLPMGVSTYNLELSELQNGTYIVALEQGAVTYRTNVVKQD